MDNLEGKMIKQFYYDDIVITLVYDKETNFGEWYGHIKGYGNIKFLLGGYKLKDVTNEETANYCINEFYDDLMEIKED